MGTTPVFLMLKVIFVGELICEVSTFNASRPGHGPAGHPKEHCIDSIPRTKVMDYQSSPNRAVLRELARIL
jgi:hypothetical protein